MKFTQHVVVWTDDPGGLRELFEDYDHESAKVAGLTGGRLLAFRDEPGRYVIQADFDSWESAQANNDRSATRDWAAKLAALITEEPTYENFDVVASYDL